MLCIDANARMGSITDDFVGPVYKQQENDNGFRMRLLCGTYRLYPCNTWFVNNGCTWVGSRGHEARLDYICFCASIHECVERCYIEDSIDLSLGERDDHRVLAAVANLTQHRHAEIPCEIYNGHKRKLKFDKEAMKDPAKCACFCQLLTTFQPPPRQRGVDDHLEAVVQH
eukprot:10939231-Karenia_brevis.AAC.1